MVRRSVVAAQPNRLSLSTDATDAGLALQNAATLSERMHADGGRTAANESNVKRTHDAKKEKKRK